MANISRRKMTIDVLLFCLHLGGVLFVIAYLLTTPLKQSKNTADCETDVTPHSLRILNSTVTHDQAHFIVRLNPDNEVTFSASDWRLYSFENCKWYLVEEFSDAHGKLEYQRVMPATSWEGTVDFAFPTSVRERVCADQKHWLIRVQLPKDDIHSQLIDACSL